MDVVDGAARARERRARACGVARARRGRRVTSSEQSLDPLLVMIGQRDVQNQNHDQVSSGGLVLTPPM